MKTYLLLILALVHILLMTEHSVAQITYETFNAPESATELTGIDQNAIIGQYPYLSTSFLYDGSSFTNIADPLATGGTFASGVSGGTVVGSFNGYVGGIFGHYGFIYSGALYTTFNYPLSISTDALGIEGTNIVGTYLDSSGNRHGFLDANGTFSSLDYPGTTNGTEVVGISGNILAGQYLGGSFIYSNGVYKNINDPLSTNGTFVTGISGNNIVGFFDRYGVNYGFLYNGSTYTTLDDPLAADTGLFGTYPEGISGSKIVGTYYSGIAGSENGFIATIVPEPNSIAFFIVSIGTLGILFFRKARGLKAR